MKKLRSIRRQKPLPLPPEYRNLHRYIHSSGYSRLVGYRGMRQVINTKRNQMILVTIFILIFGIGIWSAVH